MATLDLSRATQTVDMTDPGFVNFGTAEVATPNLWSFQTTAGHDLELNGSGMTFDAQGRALTGTVTSISIDLGNNDPDMPDISITGVNAPATTLDDGPTNFWRFLEGNDTIIGPSAASPAGYHQIYGDGPFARTGTSTGGSDTIMAGSGQTLVAGDVGTVGSQSPATPATNYKGGADTIIGGATSEYLALSGDARYVYASGTLTGGDDLVVSNTARVAETVGDVLRVEGIAGDVAIVYGGNDTILGQGYSYSTLVGDVFVQGDHSFVRGGNDRISGSDVNSNVVTELIVGDVLQVGDNQMIGGDDIIWGNGGNDRIYGDFGSIGTTGKVTAGNDTLYGGEGSDEIHGDSSSDSNTTGGNDRLFGDAGNDYIYGRTGNDLLDGGAGDDSLYGGTGNDGYVIDNGSDIFSENANEGIDTVLSSWGAVSLGANVENLTFVNTTNTVGTGNELNNVIRGGAGQDTLGGGAGNDQLFGNAGADMLFGQNDNDTLVGGAGGDQLVGEAGFDTASYAGSEQRVIVSLNGSLTQTGDAAGDTFSMIEGLLGTSFNDVLVGDAAGNMITGGGGNDMMSGLGGVDAMVGGLGNDTMAGGLGNDVFILNTKLDAATNRDTITDFSNAAGNNDVVHLDNAVFTKLAATGALNAANFRAGAGAADANDYIVYNQANGALYYDADGNGAGAAIQFATVSNLAALTAADFLVI